MKAKLHYAFFLGVFLLSFSVFSQKNDWKKKVNMNNLEVTSKFHLENDKVQYFELNSLSFKQGLTQTPLRTNLNEASSVSVVVPAYNGDFESFVVYESAIFSQSLAERYPSIKSYVGYSLTNPGAQLRMSVSPNGVQTMITYLDKETVFMMPVAVGSNEYVLYNKSARGDYEDEFVCSVVDEFSKQSTEDNSLTGRDADDQTLRTYRLAVSVNGEYTIYHGGTVPDALAAINATMTRVNAVFETDMAINFQLVDAPQLIFTDPNTDPYSGSLSAWNAELQAELTANLGEANYDIGHMFGASGGGGNAGCIGCVCEDGSKGSGITSPADGIPMGDNFDIDYVAHEIGHQMGANHTFSHNTEGTGVNAEPGSGTTIMGYAGITGANNVQQHSDPYFHYHSINQILNNVDTAPNNCAVTTAIINNPPVANAGNDHVIPQGTAYVLRGAATDADGGDALTYCWEQTDSGQVTNTSFGPTLTSGSMNRSLPPSVESDRYIPKLTRVIAGQLTESSPTINDDWETVATVGRTMNWALTVRDREPTAVGLNGQSSFDLMQINVDAASGPFTVTSQTTNVTWDAGSTQTVTWNVAGTDTGAVNTPTVNILLSVDGGLTFPYTIASDVPNDGSHDVTVPVTGGDSSMARVIVEGNNNIFYAVNSTNFSIQESEFVISIANPTIDVCTPSDAVYNGTYNTFLGFSGTTDLSVTGVPTGASAVVNPAQVTTDGTAFTVTLSGTGSLAEGSYPMTVQGVSGGITKTANITLNVFSSVINAVTLATPADTAIDIPADVNLTWNADANAQDYLVEIATDAGFANIVESATVQDANYTATLIATGTQYYWRVTASNLCATASASTVFSFTTLAVNCDNYSAVDTPVAISTGPAATYTSTLTITEDSTILDVNVTIDLPHTYVSDLDITLTSPAGTVVDLTSGNGGSGDNYSNTVFDQDASNPITGGAPPFTGTFIPEGDLSTLNGEMSAGDWVLTVVDNFNLDGGSIDEFTLELCLQGTLGVEDFNLSSSDFVIYPNPNNGSFNVKLNSVSSQDIAISVYDIRGRKVYNKLYENSSNFNETIRLNNVESGMYLLNISTDSNTITKKIIVK